LAATQQFQPSRISLDRFKVLYNSPLQPYPYGLNSNELNISATYQHFLFAALLVFNKSIPA
jgi:hypothetical protein